MQQPIHLYPVPAHLPFLQAICWQMDNLAHLSDDEMLSLYERGWNYRGVLADLEGEELHFVRELAKAKQSWLVNDVSLCPTHNPQHPLIHTRTQEGIHRGFIP